MLSQAKIKERAEYLKDILSENKAVNHEEYRFICGQIYGLKLALEEIKLEEDSKEDGK